MFKLKYFILTMLIVLIVSAMPAYCAGNISLYIDGKQIKTDVSPVIVNDRTLVPVRSIFEELGADVTWIGSRKQVIIKSLTARIVLNVDKTRAYVDDKSYELDVAPSVLDGRTMIPVRFVSETLGYDVIWDSKLNAVHVNTPKSPEMQPLIQKISVNSSSNGSTVVITVKDMKKPRISYVSEPLRFIADFPDARIYGGDSKKRMDTDDITEVRYAEHPDYSRVVIETPADAKFEVNYTSDSVIVKVTGSQKSQGSGDNKEPEEDATDEPSVTPDVPDMDINNPLIVIDPGHGGWDTGAVAYDSDGKLEVKEADANLAIALSAQKYLEAEGIDVIMTRTTDIALGTTEMDDLVARSNLANEVGASFFVSIHNNSFSNDTATGTEILYISGGVENDYGITGEILAQNILTPLVQTTGLTNRGLKNSPKILVLRQTAMPAVLIECAFVSNPDDRKLLSDEASLDDMGYAIATGILETINEFK